MSVALMAAVWKDAPFEGSTLLLLLALADSANDDGYCWPSYEALSKKVRVSRTHTIGMMKILVASGWVRKEGRVKKEDSSLQTSNGYWVVIPKEENSQPQLTTQLSTDNPPSQLDLTPPVNPSLPPQLTPLNPNHQLTEIESSLLTIDETTEITTPPKKDEPSEDELVGQLGALQTAFINASKIPAFGIRPSDIEVYTRLSGYGATPEHITKAVNLLLDKYGPQGVSWVGSIEKTIQNMIGQERREKEKHSKIITNAQGGFYG